jgi:CRISPR/Cas system-associated protein endoribonuclease Cas2
MINEMRRNMTPPISGQSQMANQYRQNLFNPGMTMQQNYIDPRLIEQMYYRGLLSK